MDDSKFLIIGSDGQLGKALGMKYPKSKAVDIDSLDITNLEAVKSFDWDGITTVLNAAAYTNVDEAETPKGRVIAWQSNATAVSNLVEVCLKRNMTLVHISTDYVFDGSKNSHTEDEPFSPLNVYGSSKAAGDVLVNLLPKFYLLRTSWVIGNGKNFVNTMLGLGDKGISPTVVSDQIGRPTFTDELVRAIDYLLLNQADFGIYNVSNEGKPVSWADLTREVFKIARFNLTVTDSTTEDYYAGKENIAPRPLISTFDLSKLHQTGFESSDWYDDLGIFIKKELSKK